jgi:uncharacterized protein YcbX
MTEVGTIGEIYIYPVKSCGGIRLDKALITKNGVAHADNPKIFDR